MAVQAAVFDIGGVLELPADTILDGRWERRLGLRPGAFFTGCADPAWAGPPTSAGFRRQSSGSRWASCTAWISRRRASCWRTCGTGMSAS